MRARRAALRRQLSNSEQGTVEDAPARPDSRAFYAPRLAKTCDEPVNIINGSEIAALFLDKRLDIRGFTATGEPLLVLAPAESSRSFSDVANHFRGGDLLSDARVVLESLVPVKRRVFCSASGALFSCSITPYPTENGSIEGVVINLCNASKSGFDKESSQLPSIQRTAAKRIQALTSRQRQVLDLVVNGLLNKEIAFRLSINQRTVETQRATIMRRLGAKSLADLIRMHIAAGLS